MSDTPSVPNDSSTAEKVVDGAIEVGAAAVDVAAGAGEGFFDFVGDVIEWVMDLF